MKDFCADELYPVNWFVHKVGKPSSKEFRREFNLVPTTYNRWEGKQPHPIKFNSPKMKKYHTKICESGALFARKFNNKAGIEVTKSCSRKRK